MAKYVREKHNITDQGIMIEDLVANEFHCTFHAIENPYNFTSIYDIYISEEDLTRAIFKLGLTQ